jgi:hypothetical protein
VRACVRVYVCTWCGRVRVRVRVCARVRGMWCLDCTRVGVCVAVFLKGQAGANRFE